MRPTRNAWPEPTLARGRSSPAIRLPSEPFRRRQSARSIAKRGGALPFCNFFHASPLHAADLSGLLGTPAAQLFYGGGTQQTGWSTGRKVIVENRVKNSRAPCVCQLAVLGLQCGSSMSNKGRPLENKLDNMLSFGLEGPGRCAGRAIWAGGSFRKIEETEIPK